MRSTRVARCPVTLFEAIVAGPWRLCPAIGELQIQDAAGALLVCQLHDLLDGQVLFQTTRPASAYFKLSERFHVIKQENGTYRGLGFSDAVAASEILDFVTLEAAKNLEDVPAGAPDFQKSSLPSSRTARPLFMAGELGAPEMSPPPPVLHNRRCKSGPLRPSEVLAGTSPTFSHVSPSSTPSPGTSPASVLASGGSRAVQQRSISLPKESATKSVPIPATPRAAKTPSMLGTPGRNQGLSPGSNRFLEPASISCGFSPGKTVKAKLHRILSGGRDKFDDMDIGYPYNVQHEGHIGWTPPPSTTESAWMDSPTGSSFVSPPLSSFGSPGSDELGGNWIAPTPPADFPPPTPPPEYLDEAPAEEPSPVTPTRTKRTFSFSRRRNRTQPQTLQKCVNG
ncbi:hypothetical protein KFL_000230250 [Klebsormidium nitens]|uniref:CRIB domain-containing protein n=1 Tax=Klebsormidium nitens TaxID=105231 RepID=A0A1Y1HKD6_KLENI|nr:hypothetical protein KFL_000230250 [Klebsormidium nitens]|eukprot:GAQ79045.1 hypothetical protein KFL_000230250 [Klebsormidium nitens]